MKVSILAKDSQKGFTLLEGINRPIVPAQVTKLAGSINKMGLIRPVVVCKTNIIDNTVKTYILDGQHLYSACLRNNMDIPYITIDVTDKADLVEKIALLNSSSRSWKMEDYITAWGSINPEYKELSRIVGIYDIDSIMTAAILAGLSAYGGTISSVIKKGKFIIADKENKLKTLDQITEVLKFVPRMDRWSNRYFINAYINFKNNKTNYNHTRFLEFLKTHKTEFVLATQDPEQLNKLFLKV